VSAGDDEEDRQSILARRALFVASALSGMALLDGCSRPQPCLSVIPLERLVPPGADAATAPPPDAPSTTPSPCLAFTPEPDPPHDDLTPDAGLPAPQPCLSVTPRRDAGPPPPGEHRPSRGFEPPARPSPCLSIAAPPAALKPAGEAL